MHVSERPPVYKILEAATQNLDPDDITEIAFDENAKGKSRARAIQLNAVLRDYFKDFEVAVSYHDIKRVLNRDVSGLYVKFEELETQYTVLSLEDCKIDKAYAGVFEDYRIFVGKDTTEYPFVIIYHEDLDVYYKYPVYRIVSGLPNFSLIDMKVRIPTVDHINRDPSDTSNENLRYCNTIQNAYNHCIAKMKFHGCKGGNVRVPNMGTKAFAIHLWGIMLDNFVTNAEIDTGSFMRSWKKNPVIMKTGCRYAVNADELDPWIGLMNQFAIEVMKWVKQEEEQLVYLDKTSTTCEFFVYKSFIGKVQDFFPLDEPIYKTVFKNEFVQALTYDIIKVVDAGEFAHTNFLKVPEPSTKVPVKPVDPVAILNNFEHHYNTEFLRQNLENNFGKQFKDGLRPKRSDFVGPKLCDEVHSVYSFCKKRKFIVAKFGLKKSGKKAIKLVEVPYKVDNLIKTPNCFYIVE